MVDFTLPELGENVTSGEVLRVLVNPGDTLETGQVVLELETDKATIEVPSPVKGRVAEVHVKVGDKVNVGQLVLRVNEEGTVPAGTERRVPEAQPESPVAGPAVIGDETEHRPAAPGADVREAPARAEDGDARALDRRVGEAPGSVETGDAAAGVGEGAAAPAAPSVRRLARELGIDIADVPGSGLAGRISLDDVKAYVNRLISAGVVGAPREAHAAEPLPDFTRWGQVERQPMRGVRRRTAEHLTAAWTTIPHVTQHDLADMTALEEVRSRYAKRVEAAGGSLTLTAIAVKVAAAALEVFPRFNTSIDLAAWEIVYKKYVNIGIAVDTDRGLLVPVVRAADTKNIVQLSVEIAQLAEKARAGKLALEEMQGGCFTVSNLGGIGGTYFTPIVNRPEVAILGMSRARTEPVWQPATGQFAPRRMLPLSLSYDHRVVDGADAVRFLRWVAEALEEPFLLALEG